MHSSMSRGGILAASSCLGSLCKRTNPLRGKYYNARRQGQWTRCGFTVPPPVSWATKGICAPLSSFSQGLDDQSHVLVLQVLCDCSRLRGGCSKQGLMQGAPTSRNQVTRVPLFPRSSSRGWSKGALFSVVYCSRGTLPQPTK